MGEWNTETDRDCVSSLGFNDCNNPPEDIPIAQMIPHSGYVDGSDDRQHDIALIRMQRPVTYTGNN